MAFKLKAIAAEEGGSKQAVARQSMIDAKRVREYVVFCNQYQQLADVGC